MAYIFNKINKVAQDPQVDAEVSVYISFNKAVSPVATVDDEELMIQGPFYSTVDEYGVWRTDVVANEFITPDDSVYKVVETVGSTDTTYFISVPDNEIDNWVGDLIVSRPSWE